MKMTTGFALALAWPETFCKQPGSWYDGLMRLFRISKQGYYRVGHAALVLISETSGVCEYYDFGRYHAPFGFGRVRNLDTDHDLRIHTKAIISVKTIVNLNCILKEIELNEACHGTGKLYAACTRVNVERVRNTVLKMQMESPLKYGPFLPNATNCSRFVRTAILSGRISFPHSLFLRFPITISPTPMSNVKALAYKPPQSSKITQ